MLLQDAHFARRLKAIGEQLLATAARDLLHRADPGPPAGWDIRQRGGMKGLAAAVPASMPASLKPAADQRRLGIGELVAAGRATDDLAAGGKRAAGALTPSGRVEMETA